MLQHQLQGYNECLPTSIAMVLGIDKEEFIESVLIGTPYTFWAEVPPDERNPLLTAGLAYWGEHYPGSENWMEAVVLPLRIPMLAVPVMEEKTGLLTIWNDHTGVGHAVAFDRGMVYDPAHFEPVPTSFWCLEAMLSGFYPFGIAVAEETS